MNMLLIKHFCVGFMVSDIPRVSVFGYFPLHAYSISYIVRSYIFPIHTRQYCV